MYPTRAGARPCQYYLRTGKCNYYQRCKFDHPFREKSLLTALSRGDCFDFVQSGSCPYGDTCKYNHQSREFVSRAAAEDGELEVNSMRLNRDSRTKIMSRKVPSSLSPKIPSRDFEPSPVLHDTIVRHLPSVTRSEGTESTLSSTPDDTLSTIQESACPFERFASSRQDTVLAPYQQRFDPLGYDAQLFGSPQSWTP